MSLFVILGGGVAMLVALLILAKFAPQTLDRIGSAPDTGSSSASGGSYGEGDPGADL